MRLPTNGGVSRMKGFDPVGRAGSAVFGAAKIIIGDRYAYLAALPASVRAPAPVRWPEYGAGLFEDGLPRA